MVGREVAAESRPVEAQWLAPALLLLAGAGWWWSAVTADAPADNEQISLIRKHLHEGASKLARGDFSNPAEIYGENMPGLR